MIIQWPYPSQTGPPVVPAPPIPTFKVSPSSWFQAVNGTVINCAAGDTAPAGFVVTDPTGAKWVKTFSPTPFGTACYYSKVAN
jgi:hypothetical protein